jgi:non-specific serine/threonine protein kinase
MLESVRDFAVAQSVDSDELGVLRRAHAEYFLGLAERAAPELAGRAQREWYLRLEQEHGNLRAALQWLQSKGEAESALRLVSALGQFWEVRGYLREGSRALEGALTYAPEADAGLRARVLTQLGSIQLSAGDSDSPRRVLPEALAIGKRLRDPDIIARALGQMGRCEELVAGADDELHHAAELLDEALDLRREVGDARDAAYLQTRLAWIALGRTRYAEVERRAGEALECYRAFGDEAGATVPLLQLGIAEGKRGRDGRAVEYMRDALETIRRLDDRRLLLLASNIVLWWLASAHSHLVQLATVVGIAEGLEEATLSMSPAPQRRWTLDATTSLRTRLGAEQFGTARSEGRCLTFSEISDLLDSLLRDVCSTRESETVHSTLTAREHQVLGLVAAGLTNKQIAAHLVVTENTVKTHIMSVFNKLGVDSRAQAVAEAARRGLLNGLTR